MSPRWPIVRAVFLGSLGVEWIERAPGPRLAPWIAAVWTLRCETAQDVQILPDGCTDIIGGDLVGTLTGPIVAHLRAGEVTTGVRLRPGAFPALLGIPASEVAGLRVPLADLRRPRPLADLIAEAPEPDPIATVALTAPSVSWLVRESGYSERQLRRRLVTATGHTPSQLRRIGRMQALLGAGSSDNWARSAVEFGYHDESHMINDVRSLAGATPRGLLHGRSLQARVVDG